MDWLSGQRIVDSVGTNGGDVVVVRTVFVGMELTLLCVCLQAWIDPDLHGPISFAGLASQLTSLGSVIGAIFGGTYVAFYTRFVSQWAYLAGVYNQIKQAETESESKVGA